MSYNAIKVINKVNCNIFFEMYKNCFLHSLYPTEWKAAKVIILNKHITEKTDPEADQPISLSSLVGKVYEKIITNRLHLQNKDIIQRQQYGLKKAYSTIDTLGHFIGIIGETQNKNWSYIATIDVQYSFNSI